MQQNKRQKSCLSGMWCLNYETSDPDHQLYNSETVYYFGSFIIFLNVQWSSMLMSNFNCSRYFLGFIEIFFGVPIILTQCLWEKIPLFVCFNKFNDFVRGSIGHFDWLSGKNKFSVILILCNYFCLFSWRVPVILGVILLIIVIWMSVSSGIYSHVKK